jgi:hypothetical protein
MEKFIKFHKTEVDGEKIYFADLRNMRRPLFNWVVGVFKKYDSSYYPSARKWLVTEGQYIKINADLSQKKNLFDQEEKALNELEKLE